MPDITSARTASPQWVSLIRHVAPYAHLHRGRTFVISVAGEVVDDRRLLNQFVMDMSLIASLGARLVLVHGSRPQIEDLMTLHGLDAALHDDVRITTPELLVCVKEACGEARFDIEAAFSQGLPNTPMQHSRVRVVSGNFVTAKPLGVIDGIDYQHTGVVRKVDVESIQTALDQGWIVLASPFGFSPTGEAFNLNTKDVAVAIAGALHADKLIFLSPDRLEMNGSPVKEITASRVRALIADEAAGIASPLRFTLRAAVRAIEEGVSRVHLISSTDDGALLQELFSHEGAGTLVAAEDMHSMREATIDDVGGLLKLLEIYEANGTLVKRPREKLEREIQHFTVLEHDGIICGSAALYPYPEAQIGEMAAVAVHPGYQGAGIGDKLLRRIESRARAAGLTRLFVLTTRTMHWFLKHGFVQAGVESLPVQKQRMYNWKRRSLIFIKDLTQEESP